MTAKRESRLAGRLPDGAIVRQVRLASPEDGLLLDEVTYMSQGLRVKGYLLMPESETPVPGLIYCRGGIRGVGMVKLSRIVPMARKGYAVFAPFYRGNEGGEGREDFGGDDRYDVYNAFAVLRAQPQVQREPIALIGFSRGALMALLAAKDCREAGPVVVWGGVSNLWLTYEERVDLRRMLRRVVGHPRKQPEEYAKRSPVCFAEQIPVPVLIVHGKDDVQVGVEHAYKLAEALERAGKSYTMHIYADRGHHFTESEDRQALDAIFRWIEEQRRMAAKSDTAIGRNE